jgi:peptidoglycan hydrolase-like protein with peptidoglycan-binding domain
MLFEHPNLFQPFAPAGYQTSTDGQSTNSAIPDYANAGTAATGAVSAASESADIDSQTAAKVAAGAIAAASVAAKPYSDAPLRILVTRTTKRDRIIQLQKTLAELGYLEHRNFDGTVGKATTEAIKAFQKVQQVPETGEPTEDFMQKVYAMAGKARPAAGHLFVRQAFDRVFDAPVSFENPDQPLGTHVFTALHFAPGDAKMQWTVISVEGGDAASTLRRIKIADDIRHKISERLTPRSTFIIADAAEGSATVPKGGDFVVVMKDSSGAAETARNHQPVVERVRSSRGRGSYAYSPYHSFRSRFWTPLWFAPW